MLFSAVLVGVMAGSGLAVPVQPGPAVVGASVSTVAARTGWLDLFVSVMHEVLWQMGGDAQGCDTSDPDKAMASFRQRFAEVGVPAGLPAEQAAALSAAARRMDELLAEAPNEASENEVQLTRSTIVPIKAVAAVGTQSRSSP